ncbi:MAG: DUF1501 domain-containing protein, partial [Acidimicrobiia bacterium]
MLTRRRFLQLTGGSLAAYGTSPMWMRLGPAWAEGATGGRKLVVLLLVGGNDGLNTVVPYGLPAYHDARPTIAYTAEEALKLPDSTVVGLNPSLAKLHGLYGAGKVAVIQGVSYDEPDLSHFASMDIRQSGSPTHDVSTGWLGRYLDASPAEGSVVRAVAIGNELPMALIGAEESGVAVPSFGGFTFYDGSDADTASEPYRLHETFLRCADAPMDSIPTKALLTSQRRTVTAVRAINGLAGAESKPPANLAEQMGMAMTLLGSNLGVEVAFLTIGSFDDHAATDQTHPKLLAQVDAAIDRFAADAAASGEPGDYLLMTFSEFGRRVAEDGSAGTDHGTAAPMFVVGDAVAGGLHGAHPSLEKTDLDKNGNMVRTVDFREVYATVLDRFLARAPSTEVLRYSLSAGLHPV